MVSMFYSGILATAEQMINTLVARDHRLASRLTALAGHAFEVSLTTPPLRCFLIIQDSPPHIRFTQVWGETPTARFSGSALNLMGLLGKNSASALREGRVTVEGDMTLARQLQSALSASSIDWEYHLSRLVGDVPANSVSELGRRMADTLRQSGENLLQDVDEYLHEERRSLPAVQEVEAFYNDIDDLRLRVDRLAARLDRLQQS